MADTKIQKSVKIVVGISTNPSVAGRYFAQLLDTTRTRLASASATGEDDSPSVVAID